MKTFHIRAVLLTIGLLHGHTALTDENFGVGVRAGTLGIGLEGTWRPLPYMDVRIGANGFDYDHTGNYTGIEYDTTLDLETLYATANFRFPLSPFRVTAGVYSNGNELSLASVDSAAYDVGGTSYSAADVGSLTGRATFPGTSPYVGIGYDFTVLGKVGLNFDVGLLWQGEPDVSMTADGLLANDPAFLASVEAERLELEDDLADFKAWPVIALGFVVNF